MDEAHTPRYSVHPGLQIRCYYDLRDLYCVALVYKERHCCGKTSTTICRTFKSFASVLEGGLSDEVTQELSLCSRHVSWSTSEMFAEPDVQVPLDEIEIDENLCFVEEPLEIVERDVKKLKAKRVPH
ncbi:hypothetical protein Tco_0256481 [Tanacetum coccineum]